MSGLTTRTWIINGASRTVHFDEDLRLLDVLREELDLIASKEGCGEGECGACSVLQNDELILSCLALAAAVPDGTRLTTAEGLEGTDIGRRLKEAFLQGHALQCGFCTPGMLVAAYYLLIRSVKPEREDIKQALAGNLCRCTGYEMIIESVLACAAAIREGGRA